MGFLEGGRRICVEEMWRIFGIWKARVFYSQGLEATRWDEGEGRRQVDESPKIMPAGA